MAQEMLDLDRHVVGDIGMRRMERLDHAHRMCRTIEEIGIAERDVLGASPDLRVDVGEDDVSRHDAKLAAVDRHDGAVPAQVLAAPACFGGADGFRAAVADMQGRVVAERRQAVAIGHEEMQAWDRRGALARRAGLQACELRQLLLELAAEDRVDTQ